MVSVSACGTCCKDKHREVMVPQKTIDSRWVVKGIEERNIAAVWRRLRRIRVFTPAHRKSLFCWFLRFLAGVKRKSLMNFLENLFLLSYFTFRICCSKKFIVQGKPFFCSLSKEIILILEGLSLTAAEIFSLVILYLSAAHLYKHFPSQRMLTEE